MSAVDPAPIALFAFKRPHHLRRTTDALKANVLASRSKLYVFCDAARSDADVVSVDEVRRAVDALEGFASIEVIHRRQNMGLARSIISGVDQVLAAHGRVIVVEDDLVTSSQFLTFMNDALDLYADEPRVASIHGYVYPVATDLPSTFFQRGADCWGWATWSRAWAHFNPDAGVLLEQLEASRLIQRFDLEGSYSFSGALRDHVAGRNDSWAIRWHASTFVNDMLTLYPGRSLVENIGFDSSGTHCGISGDFGGAVDGNAVQLAAIPIVEDETARQAFVDYFWRLQAEASSAVSYPISQPQPVGPRQPGLILQKVSGWLRRRHAG